MVVILINFGSTCTFKSLQQKIIGARRVLTKLIRSRLLQRGNYFIRFVKTGVNKTQEYILSQGKYNYITKFQFRSVISVTYGPKGVE